MHFAIIAIRILSPFRLVSRSPYSATGLQQSDFEPKKHCKTTDAKTNSPGRFSESENQLPYTFWVVFNTF